MTLTHDRLTAAPPAPERLVDVGALVDLERGVIDRSIFSDEAIYQQELEQVFARCWLMLCPEGSIPRKGDFFATSMGEDPVLVVRQKDGSIRAFLNSCRHRGMKVCRADMGNTKGFTCTYHGWSYDTAGNLINLPFEEKGYHNELPKDEWGLIPVAQLDTYRGLVFATWDPTAPPLLDYLGDDFRFYMDGFLDRTPGGLEPIGGQSRWRFKGNWKFAAEQFASDNYHAPFSHASAFQALTSTVPDGARRVAEFQQYERAYQFSSRLGHGCGFRYAYDKAQLPEHLTGDKFAGWIDNDVIPTNRARFADTDPLHAGSGSGHHTLFPNCSWLSGASNTLRIWHPRGPDAIEVQAWAMVDRDAPEEVREEWRTAIIRTFSVSGMLEQDDGENWGEIQKVLRGTVQRRHPFNYMMGKGHENEDGEEYPGTTGFTMNEMAARGFYRRWAELMQGSSWSDIPPAVEERS